MAEATPPIVLIHGLWMTPRSWERWIDRFQQRGHTVLAPAWPGLEGEVEALRADPSPIAGLGIEEIVHHYDTVIRGLDTPPIIMGHSFGGTFTQILLDRGLGAAGVAIDSASVKGVLTLPFSTLRTAWPALHNPANLKKAIDLDAEQFRWRFTNLCSEEESARVYDRYYVPGSGRVLFQAGLANFNPHAPTAVDFSNDDRAPLLFIAGGKDHVSPPALNKANFAHYNKSAAVTDYHEFPDRGHYTLGEPGWEAVADYALNWAVRHAEAHTGRHRATA